MTASEISLRIAVAAYGVSLPLMIIAIATARRKISLTARTFVIVGLAVHTLGLIFRWHLTGEPPFLNRYESIMFCTWAMVVMAVAFELRYRSQLLSLLTTAIMFIMLVYGVFYVDSSPEHRMPALQEGLWLYIHICSYFIGYGSLTVATGAAIADLILRGIGSSQTGRVGLGAIGYNVIAHRVVAVAFPLITVGLISGAIWRERIWGGYWGWDVKETWSLITWLLYLVYLHAPWVLPKVVKSPRVRAWLMSVWLLVCFLGVMVTYLGLKYLPSAAQSLHLYAE